MDPLGVLGAVVALAAYPGGLYLAALVWLSSRYPANAGWPALRPRELAALIIIDLAVAAAPLPASPVGSLPPTAGAAPNVVITGLLVAASIVLVAPRRWNAAKIAAVAGAATAAALAVVAAASLALTAITAESGGQAFAVRAIAAVALVLAAPVLLGTPVRAPLGRRVVLTSLALLAVSLFVPPGLAGWAAVAGAAATGAATVALLFTLTAAHSVVVRAQTALGAACAVLGAATILVVVIGGRI